MSKLRFFVSTLALVWLPNAQAAYSGSLSFVQPTGTVQTTDSIPVWLKLSLDAASEPLVFNSIGGGNPPFGINPANYPTSFSYYNSNTSQSSYINDGVLIAVDSISFSTSIACTGTFLGDSCSLAPYEFNFNDSGPDSILAKQDISLSPGDSLEYLLGTFKPNNGTAPAGNYEFYESGLTMYFYGTVRAPKLDDNGAPVLDGSGNPVLVDFVNAEGSLEIAGTECTSQNIPNCADIFTRTVVAPVPVPAAFWLFGSVMLGFVGCSRRGVVTRLV
ncbi:MULTISPECIES: hypothetical protein [Methylomonas]|uniref:PEP-CTERM protein-sorting domain-containing protein n=2 Tax=Methylomonas TaxID=416 RepID=A0A126T8X3_9GAMM|nr:MULTISPECIES: hypothetical protein [Methylomonas]AMK78535.1 hypothetical protein JT25_018910 [Methylomonas denitrificans]OAI09094.1 hypothetical protein A1342_13305 [Methylomonas methanica]TCV82302.1 hypothetical protein EDE11_11465 [Methylomonas methanica]